MVFAASGLLPSSKDVLFCTDRTPSSILEAFIMRAFLYDSKMKSYKSTIAPVVEKVGVQDKVFMIANFHKLNLQTQNDIYEFIKRQETQYAKSRFSLYVFSVGADTRQVNLIEEIRNQTQSFNHHFNEQ